MRFGKTLRQAVYEPWRDYYIDYEKLKKLLREDDSAASSPTRAGDQAWTDQDAEKFYHELANVQLEKVQNFHKEMYQKLSDRAAKCEANLDPIAAAVKQDDQGTSTGEQQGASQSQSNGEGKRPAMSEGERDRVLKDTLKELDSITKEISELEKYSRINYTGFLKIAKKHDRKRGGRISVKSPLQSLLVKVPFNKEDYSPLLYRISAMYSFARQQSDSKSNGRSFSDAQAAGQTYTSHKFWVHPDNLLEVKTNILRRLPVLVYNPQTSKVAEAGQRDPTLTSIYFDNPKFSLYNAKVEHTGKASSLRLRWYDRLSERHDIVIEKKTVDDDNTSTEQRFSLKEKYIQSFLKGEYSMDKQIKKLEDRAGVDSTEVKEFKQNIQDIQSFIKEQELQPLVRATYTRTAFQIPGDSRVRISLDTNLAFIREDAIDTDRPIRDPEDWHRHDIDDQGLEYPYKSIRKGEVSRFPFALLEIKIKGHKSYEWIEDLMSSHLVREAPRFSKFVHGVAELFENNVNIFPFWLSALDEDIRQAPEDAFKAEQARKQKQAEDEIAVGSLIGKSSLSKTPPAKLMAMSPVGSPAASSPMAKRQTEEASKRQSLDAIVEGLPASSEETAGEVDSDEDGNALYGGRGGLKSLFPSFSTSKYARRKRARDAPLPPGVEKPDFWIKDQGPVKVEGKVWLANQRTFIKWQHVSVLLATLSLGLFNAAGKHNTVAKALAAVYTLLAVFIGAWGYGVYIWRCRLIERRSGKDFDALTGPLVTCLGLIVALTLNFAFKYNDLKHRQAESNWATSYVFGINGKGIVTQ
ncbi:SPX-domain-containing protein [Myriangium duriaei CBS 260.36]|uniref:SPX-domain-containing protein n=1 Tax=Myriangium duriaei CBS 260.36 TaxID=1168546 RepID=A0A9P4J7J2_9PEZI|nr:SPX-domain-containing protein [Myriangium duriaei CBS 260.36]